MSAKRKILKKKTSQPSEKSLKLELVTQMLTLATSSFGLVAALAWNSAITLFVQKIILDNLNKNFPKSSELMLLISQLIYAILITILAVTITYQLSKISATLQAKK